MTIYLSLILFRQHGYRNNFRFPFSSLLTLLLSLLYKTPVAIQFPAKITSSCICVAIVILRWYTCGADGRSLGRAVDWSVYGHVITKFSRMGRKFHFLTHGAPLARLARKSSSNIDSKRFSGRQNVSPDNVFLFETLQHPGDIFWHKLLFCHLPAISSLLLPRFAITCDRKSEI